MNKKVIPRYYKCSLDGKHWWRTYAASAGQAKQAIYVCWMVVQMIAIYLSCAVLIAQKRHRRLRIMLSTEISLLLM